MRKYVRVPQWERRKWSHESLIYCRDCIFSKKEKEMKEKRGAEKWRGGLPGSPAVKREGWGEATSEGCECGWSHFKAGDEGSGAGRHRT